MMRVLIVPSVEDVLWGALRVYAGGVFRPVAAMHFKIEVRNLLNQLEATYTKHTHGKLPDSADTLLNFFD
jgi:hypothetical protein